ncbi:hypothetical protein PCASD_20410 [Puccinia coronata f. sp. avenae]|uniref:Uncharacterized protein n=1 Tax=Puccinia coronata f. sp. avenae TaxID=200324 RepID=A0A2N5U1W1_9BASI|nr:hypothetical protein PCASD_20410 [Puccinia coronata f. sp. avenae]
MLPLSGWLCHSSKLTWQLILLAELELSWQLILHAELDESDSVTLGSTDTIKTASNSGSDFPVESDVKGGLVTLGSEDTIDTNEEEVAESSMEVINKPDKDTSIEESNDSMTIVGVEDIEEYELVASYEEQPINEEEVDELDSEFEIDVKNEVANS